MQPDTSRARFPGALRPLIAACAVAAAGGAGAQESGSSPYYVGVSQAFTYDSNIYRVRPKDGVENDVYSSTGLLAGIDQPFGRQRFYANGNVRLNRYNDLDNLNNTSFGLVTGLDWSTIGRVSGNLRLDLNQSLASYSTTNSELTSAVNREKNIQKGGQLQARVQWGMVSLLSLEGAYTAQRLRYSAASYEDDELDQDAFSVGVKYRPSGLLTLGAALRHTRGEYLNRASDRKYTRNDIDLTTTWIATGQSTIDGRLSFGRQRYKGNGSRDFSGATGEVAWLYRPTGKLTFNTVLSRDTGQESTFQSGTITAGTTVIPITTSGDDSKLTTSVAVSAGYAATGKINVNAGLRYIHRTLDTTFNSVELDGSDTIKIYTLGATYAFSRSLLFACNVGRDSRSVSSGTSELLSYPYRSSTASCSAQFQLSL